MDTWGERRKVGCSKKGQSMVACREAFVDMVKYTSLAPTLLSRNSHDRRASIWLARLCFIVLRGRKAKDSRGLSSWSESSNQTARLRALEDRVVCTSSDREASDPFGQTNLVGDTGKCLMSTRNQGRWKKWRLSWSLW